MSHWEMPNHLKPKEKRKKTSWIKGHPANVSVKINGKQAGHDEKKLNIAAHFFSVYLFLRNMNFVHIWRVFVFVNAVSRKFCVYLILQRMSKIRNMYTWKLVLLSGNHRIFLSFIVVLIFQSRFCLFFFLFLSINSWFRGNTLGNTFGETPSLPIGSQYSSQFFPMKIRRLHWYGPVELRKDWWGLNIIILIHLARESLILLWRSTLETIDEYQMDILSLFSISSACTIIHNQASLLRSISRPEVFCKKCS